MRGRRDVTSGGGSPASVPPPRPAPTGGASAPGAGRGGPALGDPRRGPRTPPLPPPPSGSGQIRGIQRSPSPRGGEERPVGPGRAPPRPARPSPALPPRPPRGRAGTARSPAALWAARLSRRTSRPARPAPRPPAFVVPASSAAAACGPRASRRDLGSALRGPGLRGPGGIQERRGGLRGAPPPRHGARGRRLVAAVRGCRAGRLRPRRPCQQEPELQRSPPDIRRQGLQPERRAPGGDLG